ncbi:MAG: Gfo/Idh/MocA family oxidoreductase [Fimbriimonadaceae bacterium]|nr:Gfo/Idh/MocA family oxidoreductase [Fimbriimonadaceae bacterium]
MTRRGFLATSGVAAATLMAPSGMAFAPRNFIQGRDRIRVGLIGCGGRGTGAAFDCFNADPSTDIVAIGDLFGNRTEGTLNRMKEQMGDRCKVTSDTVFVGFDAYQKVLATECDLVILATPPGFRPIHFEAAIDAGKHVFMEKPVAVDAPGVRRVISAGEKATGKKLCVVAGTQRRHDYGYREVIKRIHDGAIGDVVCTRAYWNQGALWSVNREPAMNDVEWQVRNWLYFTYLSGDHICEQHIHNIDVCNWVKDDHPMKAVALGGRQVRTEEVYGQIYDHFAVEYTYADETKMHSYCRQQDNTASNVSEAVVGTKGTSDPAGRINGENEYRWQGDKPNPYVQEHKDLIDAIRGSGYVNESRTVAESTLTAIMGRMAAYTGQEVTWDQAMASEEVLMPDALSFGDHEVMTVAMPGKTPFK